MLEDRVLAAAVRVVIGAAACILAAGCGGALPKPDYAPQPTAALVVVGYPPPPARVEFVPAPPAHGAVWIDGEWAWRSRRWSWKAGRWLVPPAGARFSPWTVVRGPDGTTYYAPGTWRDAAGAEVDEPTALATARSNPGEVVDAEGEHEDTGRTTRATPRN